MKVSICIGSACHLKGSRDVIREMQQLIAEHDLVGKVNLTGGYSAARGEVNCTAPPMGPL